jgi:hypothetical protein
MMERCVKIVAGDPTPLQRSAWARLWAVLLNPEPQGITVTVAKTLTGIQHSNVASEDERDG